MLQVMTRLMVDNKSRLGVFLFQRVVTEELFNEVDVCKNHSAAAVSLELEFVESITEMLVNRRDRTRKQKQSSIVDIPFGHVLILQVGEVSLPLITNNLFELAIFSPEKLKPRN